MSLVQGCEQFYHLGDNCTMINMLQKRTMSGGKTIESYVADIMQNLEDLDYDSLCDIYETLRRMKNSGKLKHELNYWKVLQCLGEMAGDLYLKSLRSRIKSQQGNHEMYSVILVGYCSKMLLGLIELGDMKTRNVIRRSHAKQAVIDYVVKVRKESKKHDFVLELISYFQQMKSLLEDENEAQLAVQNWNAKVKLKEDLELGENDIEYLFCSSPSCRKQCTDLDHFRYCGACRLARYCSQTCQKEHWKNGHKLKCLKDPPVILNRGCGSKSCHKR
ncbi:hypothetical protein KUTeg_007147 [Tegillarca granosa]|uniref:MYND-type domain-containing protein n=1 Tax=Tegillarca granosa TaxID=220873 RepID=A0ABQ9FGK4_TEGGR|nr:hypothetical protein KUTeg_007147 [Tegillarca granosa]